MTNIAMMFGQMLFLLVALTSIDGNRDADHFLYFYGPFAGISFLLLVKYLLEYARTENPADKLFIRRFFSILGARTSGLLLALFLPYQTNRVNSRCYKCSHNVVTPGLFGQKEGHVP
ncbi:hypothetical protein ABID29_000566 [Streptococcus rupicaprae]|uniref:Uncharacterized protein n=1 Tax=Streptococcus rupicaprae TaxID=759619 RepID=A0ABV2FFW2_9STRE